MRYRINRPRYRTIIQLFSGICLASLLVLVFFPLHTSAKSSTNNVNGPVIENMLIGFNGKYQDQNWVPVQIFLRNNGSDFSGKVTITIPSSSGGYSSSDAIATYQALISLPSGTPKQITMYVPFTNGTSGGPQNVVVNLLDNNGQKVASRTAASNMIGAGVLNIGILSDLKNSFGAIGQVSPMITGSTINTEPLTAATMPTTQEALKNFDMLVLDNFTTSTLSQDQLQALKSWVDQGGSLILVGGPEWRRTLSALPTALLPVTITGTDTLPGGTQLLPTGGPGGSTPALKQPADSVADPVVVSVATVQPDSSVHLTAGNIPLLVQSTRGQGSVFYIAFDPALAPVFGWSNISSLWQGLITRSLADQVLTTTSNTGNNGQISTYNSNMDQLVRVLIPNTSPSPWLILILLLSYVLILGPIRLLIVRRVKKRTLSWRIVLSTIVIFTFLSYGLALQQKGTAVISSRVSVIQLNRPDTNGSTAHIKTYLGVYVPSQGDFHVHIPNATLVQPGGQNPFQSSRAQSAVHTTFTAVNGGSDVDLQGVEIWTLRTLTAQHDAHTTGGIVSHLTLQSNTVTGSVTNTLPYALSDAYVLSGNDFAAVGRLHAGETKTISLPLTNSTQNNSPQLLSDQIASSQHISNNQSGPFPNTNQLQDEAHRHMAMLASLSGENVYCGGGCYGRPLFIRGNTKPIMMNPYQPNNSHDPLLLSGASATLIGWADPEADPANKLTINGNAASGPQEAFVQAPLDLNFAGTIQVPSSLISSQLINIQQDQAKGNTNIQEPSADIYTITTGSMNFEFTLPTTNNLQQSSLTITTQSNATATAKSYITNQFNGTLSDINHLHTYLYNWQKGRWDAFSFNPPFTLSIQNAQPYIDADGHVLMQVANQDTSLGTTIFSKPLLQVQGTMAN